jgi:predicted metalloprotease with PDZ domain
MEGSKKWTNKGPEWHGTLRPPGGGVEASDMKKLRYVRVMRLCLALTLGVSLTTGSVAAQGRPLRSAPVTDLHYEVAARVSEVINGHLDVTLRFRVAGTQPVILSMPSWTPGSYSLDHFAREVSGFEAKQGTTAVRWDKLDPDTWRVRPERAGDVELTYRVRAQNPDVSASWTGADVAFFNGTNVFLSVDGYLDLPARVTVRTEPSWRVATGMTPGDSARQYRARDYHDLVDHPVLVGRFDLDSLKVMDKWMRLATYPVGSVQGPRRAAYWDALARSTESLAAVFGEVPWTSYTVLQVATEEFQGMSALEHSESELAMVGMPFLDEPFVLSVHAHEIAHAWNVKRLRPAEMVPYRYDTWQPTPWLWISEGITDYYADLALVRSGITDEADFLTTTLGKMESVDARPATALEDASLQAWLGMQDGTGDLYYDKGSLAGLALDILIRDASDNQRSLDMVMRELYDRTYKAGRGFTHDDVWNAIARASGGRAWGDFERRYIDGREPFPWTEWLPKGGWRLVTDSINEPRLGVLLREDPRGVMVSAVDPEGAGARAGLQMGDILTEIGGQSTRDADFGERWRGYWGKRPGAALPLTVLREDAKLTLTATVELETRVERRIEPIPDASPRARRIRAGILTGTPKR